MLSRKEHKVKDLADETETLDECNTKALGGRNKGCLGRYDLRARPLLLLDVGRMAPRGPDAHYLQYYYA